MAPRILRILDTVVGDLVAQVGDPNPQSPIQLLSGYAGGSAGQIKGAGNFSSDSALAAASQGVQIVSAGSSPSATGADKILGLFNIPAGYFDAAGRGINIFAQGSTAANTNTKTIKIIINPTSPVLGATVSGGTAIATMTLNTVAGGGGWQLEANVYKYGALGSNTQIALHQAGQGGNVVASLGAPSLLTLTESGVIPVAVTGNSATTAGDTVFNFLEAFGLN